MMPDDINVEKYFTVDEYNLETELGSCASLYYLFSEYAIEMELSYSQASLALEHHELTLANQFKLERSEEQKNSKYKIDPYTETEIKRMYRGDNTWNILKNKELELLKDYKKMEKAAKAIEMKSQNCMSINKRQLWKAGKGMEDI